MHREHPDARAAQHEEHGFTLIELLMVILIIAILVAVLVPVFLGASARAKDRAMQSSLHTGLKAAKGLYTDKTDYTLATPAALTSEAGVGALTFVGAAVPPNGQKSVGVDAVSSAYIVLSGQSKSGDCFYVADDQLTGTTLYARAGGAGGCAANAAPLPGDVSWKPAW
jgi:prepilin-type N-terminal cleavage/methylation domain-containing protein